MTIDHDAILAHIEFPSAEISFGDLLGRFPDQFGWDWRFFAEAVEHPAIDWVLESMHLERELAIRAYRQAAGMKQEPRSDGGPLQKDDAWCARKDLVNDLVDLYSVLGVEGRPTVAREMIRRFESEAAALAPNRVSRD